MKDKKLAQLLGFIVEIDKLKLVMRRSYITGAARYENPAEHSWHLAIMALLLEPYANTKINILRVLKMVLIHDLVEIDAGDTYCYSKHNDKDKKHQKEKKAARRIFGLLPKPQGVEFRKLFEEFDRGATTDARFAMAIDRLHPMLQNYATKGKSWKKHGVTSAEVMERNMYINDGSQALWVYAKELVAKSVKKGYLES